MELIWSKICRGEVLEIDTWVRASGKNGMKRDWLIRSQATGQVFARATRYQIISSNMPSLPCPLPYDWLYLSLIIDIMLVQNMEQHLGDDEPENKAPLENARRGEGWDCTLVYRETGHCRWCPWENCQVGQQGYVCEQRLEGKNLMSKSLQHTKHIHMYS